MNDYTIYDVAKQRYADLVRTAAQEAQRPHSSTNRPGRWSAAITSARQRFAVLLTGRTA
jgi:hypothetical protein